jgi:predicted RNA-binding Zn-ribbon protein involved in translation (DUF1610 family)
MIILEKGERADPLWGMDTEIITDEMIEALEQGKRLYLSVNDEYAVVIKKNGKRKTDKPEATDTDTISRQQTIDAIEILLEQSEDDDHDKTWNNAIRGSINAVKHHVPSAQPHRVGRWIHCQYPYSKCSICGDELDTLSYEANYCPNCGAKMIEDEND